MSDRMAKDMLALRDTSREQGIFFFYNGFVTEEILTEISQALRRKFEIDDVSKSVSRRLFSIFVEQVQNVIRYSEEYQTGDLPTGVFDLRYGIVVVGRTEEQHFITCCNVIDSSKKPILHDALEHIQSLKNGDLMKLYKEIIRGETPAGSKGAGVGMIEVARQAKGGFEFDFQDMENNRTYFCIKAYV